MPFQLPGLLVVARHAESARNRAKGGDVFFPTDDARAGQESAPDQHVRLTEAGRGQARDLGERLLATYGSFDTVFHSGYRRTAETAERAIEAWPSEARAQLDVREHLFLRERDVGYAYNMTAAEAKHAFPWLQPYWDLSGPFFARPPGGESIADVAGRVHAFLEVLGRDVADRRVLVVAHGGTLRMFRYWLERWTHDEAVERWRREPVPNCHIVAYRPEIASRPESHR